MKRIVILNDLKESDIRPDNVYDRYKELLKADIQKYFIVFGDLHPVSCPGCGSGQIERTFIVMGLSYCVCGKCDSWYVSPRPSKESLTVFHQKSPACVYLRNNLFKETGVVRIKEIFSSRLQWIAGLVEEYLPDARIFVDRGSRYPALLSQIVKQNLFQKILLFCPECFEQEGFLPQEAEIFRDNFPLGYADVYAAFEQIERGYNPKSIIEEAALVCKPGGIFVLTTNTSSGFEYQVLLEHSPNLIPFDRLNLLSFEALLRLLDSYGFKVVEASTPGRLDVGIVRKALEKSGGNIPGHKLWKYIFDYRSPEALHTLQEFFQRFQLSSYVKNRGNQKITGAIMNNLEKIFVKSNNFKSYFHGYLDYLMLILKSLDEASIERFMGILDSARLNEETIFLAGNGGSASTATHMANDLGTDTLKYSKGKTAFRTLALTDNTAVMSAVANDDGYENIFINQLRIHYRKGDVFIGISASGNSPNVVKAAQWVKDNGGKVLAMVGFDGGRLKSLADEIIYARSDKGEYGVIEDIHMIMDHLMSNWFQRKILKENKD